MGERREVYSGFKAERNNSIVEKMGKREEEMKWKK